jgi:alpha-tubulin suppressor-like RCC1 family protein
VVQVAAGDDCSCFVTASGRLFIAGTGEDGELGFGAGFECLVHPTELTLFHPVLGRRLRVTFASCGGQHTMVLAEGRVFTFGNGRDGQLGKSRRLLVAFLGGFGLFVRALSFSRSPLISISLDLSRP